MTFWFSVKGLWRFQTRARRRRIFFSWWRALLLVLRATGLDREVSTLCAREWRTASCLEVIDFEWSVAALCRRRLTAVYRVSPKRANNYRPKLCQLQDSSNLAPRPPLPSKEFKTDWAASPSWFTSDYFV